MPGLIERIGSLAGTEAAKAVNLAHSTYQDRMAVHSHTGRALIESAIAVARIHPNLVGIGVALIVEQLLVEERRLHESHAAAAPPVVAEAALSAHVQGPAHRGKKGGVQPHLHAPDPHLSAARLHRIRPGRIALEVFGALILLKLGAVGARMFRRKHAGEIWFAPAARIHIFSASIAAYNLAAAMRSPAISAWRNGAIAFFGTDALKPLLKARPTRLGQVSAPSPDDQPTPPPRAAVFAPESPSPAPTLEPALAASLAEVTPFAPLASPPVAPSLRAAAMTPVLQ